MPPNTSNEPIAFLQRDFRYHLDQFYTFLNLAPPYHSVEKAIRYLTTELRAKKQKEQQQIAENESIKWDFYGQVFINSGLNKKHRGIIQSLAQSHQPSEISTDHWYFLKFFSS